MTRDTGVIGQATAAVGAAAKHGLIQGIASSLGGQVRWLEAARTVGSHARIQARARCCGLLSGQSLGQAAVLLFSPASETSI